MPEATGLFETHLTVSDLDRSIEFYRDVVGLPLALVLEERGAAFFWIGGPGQAMLGLWSLGSAPLGLSLHIARGVARGCPRRLRPAALKRRHAKNMAVAAAYRGREIGRRLIDGAIDLARAKGHVTLAVATAAADLGNLRFYQRAGFRMRGVERDAFTPSGGYPAGMMIDGIQLRDRVWLDLDMTGQT